MRTIRRLIVSLRDRVRRAGTSLDRLQRKMSPVFVIGANRSGTSLVAHLLGQHPELEGIFTSGEPGRDDSGHWKAHSESLHVWPALFPDDADRSRSREWPLWALPDYLGATYRRRAESDQERLRLAWALHRRRATDLEPLVKDNFNSLRVGLVKDVFPRARFVLVSRRWGDYLEAAAHKWSHDATGTLLDPAVPRIGLHWLTLNLVVRYDLETFAPDAYSELWLDEVIRGPESARRALRRLLGHLDLTAFEFDLSSVEFRGEAGTASSDGLHLSLVGWLVKSERRVLEEMLGSEAARSKGNRST